MDPKELLNKLTNNPWDRIEVYKTYNKSVPYLSIFIKNEQMRDYFFNSFEPDKWEDIADKDWVRTLALDGIGMKYAKLTIAELTKKVYLKTLY